MAEHRPGRYAKDMSGMHRRGFLHRAALAGGALVLPSGLLTLSGGGLTGCTDASSKRRTDHYVVFYLMVGGWDLMLTTDPVERKAGFFVPYDDDDIQRWGDVRVGPAMAPLHPFVDRLTLLRGVYVDALNHPQARFRMVTGQFKPPGNYVAAPSVQTLIAQARSSDYHLPNLSSDALRPAVFRGEVEDERLEPVRVSSIGQLRGLSTIKGNVSKYRREIEEALQARDALTTKHWETDQSSSTLPAEFEKFASLERSTAASRFPERLSRAQTTSRGADGKRPTRVDKQVDLAVEAIRQDLAPVITVGTGEFDSHTRYEYGRHPEAVARGIRGVADIARGLQETVLDDGRNLLDLTTIVVTSEFSRTPSRNELGGKHHWPTNSFLLLGKGLRRGPKGEPRVFGSVDESLVAEAINPRNGSRRQGADLVDMSHGLATVLALAGLDPAKAIQQEPILPLLA